MNKHLLCLILVGAIGCVDQAPSDPSSATSAPATSELDANAVALAKFTCPSMH